MITQVPKEDLHIVWDQVEQYIKKALDDTYTARDIFDGIITNRFQLFISWENKEIESEEKELRCVAERMIFRKGTVRSNFLFCA